jgi:hypothetical protein
MVSAGLTQKEVEAQSNCFIFRNGRVSTYNDEIFCKVKSGLEKKFQAAVSHDRLVPLLQKMPDDTVNMEVVDDVLTIKGSAGKRKARIPLDVSVNQAIDSVDRPSDEWITLPERFHSALGIVASCSDAGSSHFFLTCVRMNPKYMQATDNSQVIHYRLKTGISDCLLQKKSLLKLIPLEPAEYNETESWIHFRNGTGLLVSLRKYPLDRFPSIKKCLDFTGDPLSLNNNLSMATDLAAVFTKGKPEEHILVKIRKGKIVIVGEGSGGKYSEVVPTKYKGRELDFIVNPQLFIELTKKTTDCEITEDKLKVVGSRFTYVACLLAPNKTKPEAKDADTE